MSAPRRFPRAAPLEPVLGAREEPLPIEVREAALAWLVSPPCVRQAFHDLFVQELFNAGLFDLNFSEELNVRFWMNRLIREGWF